MMPDRVNLVAPRGVSSGVPDQPGELSPGTKRSESRRLHYVPMYSLSAAHLVHFTEQKKKEVQGESLSPHN